MRNWQSKTTISLATLGLAACGVMAAGGAAAWCPDPDRTTATQLAPAAPAAPLAISWQERRAPQPDSNSRTVHIITQDSREQDGDEGHSFSLKRSISDGDVKLELEIDGEKYDVETMDEVRKILREKGIDHQFEFHMDDQHWNQMVPRIEAPHLDLNDSVASPLQIMPRRLFGDGDETLTYVMGDSPKAMLGIHMSDVGGALAAHLDLDEGQGVLITSVVEDSPADSAGFQQYDIVTAARVGDEDEWQTTNQQSLRELIAEQEPETAVAFQIIRAGNGMELEATLEEWDGPRMGITRQFFGPSASSAGTTPRIWTQPRVFQHDQLGQPFRFNEQALEQYMEQLKRQMEEFERYFEQHMEQLHEHQDELHRQLEQHREQADEQPVDA